MYRWFCVLLMLALSASLSYATCGVRTVRTSAVVTTPVVVQKSVVAVDTVFTPVAVFAAFPVAVPTYTAAYSPAAVAPSQQASTGAVPASTPSEMALVLSELKKLNGRIDAIERRMGQPGGPPPMPRAEELPTKARSELSPEKKALALFGSKCAVCHNQGNETKGGGFVLLSGGAITKLDSKQLVRLSSHVYKGTMPPRSSGVAALTDEEVGEVMNWIDTQR